MLGRATIWGRLLMFSLKGRLISKLPASLKRCPDTNPQFFRPSILPPLNFLRCRRRGKPRLYQAEVVYPLPPAVVRGRERPYNLGYVGRCSPATNSSAQSCAANPVLRCLLTAGGAHRWHLVALLDRTLASAATGWQHRGAGDFVQDACRARRARCSDD